MSRKCLILTFVMTLFMVSCAPINEGGYGKVGDYSVEKVQFSFSGSYDTLKLLFTSSANTQITMTRAQDVYWYTYTSDDLTLGFVSGVGLTEGHYVQRYQFNEKLEIYYERRANLKHLKDNLYLVTDLSQLSQDKVLSNELLLEYARKAVSLTKQLTQESTMIYAVLNPSESNQTRKGDVRKDYRPLRDKLNAFLHLDVTNTLK